MNKDKLIIWFLTVVISLLLVLTIEPRIAEYYREQGRVEADLTCQTVFNNYQISLINQLRTVGYIPLQVGEEVIYLGVIQQGNDYQEQ